MVSSEFRSVENEMNKGKFSRTARACYAGIVNQAIITNVTALLFVSFIELYNFSYIKLGMLTAVNFAAQMCADFLLIFLIDRVSFRKLAVFSCTLSFAGLLFYGCVPFLFSEKGLFTGIVCATTVFAFAGGMSEVVLSNIADNIPRLENSVSICLLKTVYAWAQVGLVAVCAVFLTVFGSESWNYLMFGFALIPLGAAVLVGGAAVVKKSGISKPKSSFHLFYILALVAIFLGYGSEIAANQWISVFATAALGVGGEWSEFVGMGLFAVCLGVGGLTYVAISKRKEHFPLPVLIFAALSTCALFLLSSVTENVICALVTSVCCGLFVGVLSPGIMTVASENMPSAGAWMIASLAVCADLGAAALPSAAGSIAELTGIRTAYLTMSVAPFLCAAVLFVMHRMNKKKKQAGKLY